MKLTITHWVQLLKAYYDSTLQTGYNERLTHLASWMIDGCAGNGRTQSCWEHGSALSYTLLALMRQLLPEALTHHRAMTLRWRLYAIAGKGVRSGRQLFVKLKEKHRL